MELLLAVALPVALVAAIRGTWSPCGLSMLSSLTPMTEAGRGNRFRTTAAWFVVGGIVGGLTLGAVAAAGAAALDAANATLEARVAVGAAVAALTAAIDLGLLGIDLPIFKRQVDDAWLRRYRGWVYGVGFGWQIGVGVATYIMTAGVFLTIVLAVLTASPGAALLVGAAFGVVRGSSVYLGRSATDPAALGRVHALLDRWGPVSRLAAALVQVAAGAVLAGWLVHPLVGAAVAVAGGAVAFTGRTASPRPAGA